MKLIFYTTTITALVGLIISLFIFKHEPVINNTIAQVEKKSTYINSVYNYSLDLPDGYKLDETIPELIWIENDQIKIRVNFGCYEFGTEDLQTYTETFLLNNRPALKQTFYSADKLMFKRVTIDAGEQCIAIEYWASEHREWQDAEELILSFRITE